MTMNDSHITSYYMIIAEMAHTENRLLFTVYRHQHTKQQQTRRTRAGQKRWRSVWDERRFYPLIFFCSHGFRLASIFRLMPCHIQAKVGLGCLCKWMDGLSVRFKSWLPISRLICKYVKERKEMRMWGWGWLFVKQKQNGKQKGWMIMMMMMRPLKTKS